MIIDPENLSRPREGKAQIFRGKTLLAEAMCHLKRVSYYDHPEIEGYLTVGSPDETKALYELPDVALIMEFPNGDRMPFQITGKDIFKGRFDLIYVARMPTEE